MLTTEMLVWEHIARLQAEADHDRLVKAALRASRTSKPHAVGGWWRRLMGMPSLTPRRVVGQSS
jgi:hypothetical protein